jgi:hypothetical protein
MRFYKSEIKGTFLPDAAGTRSLGSAVLSFLEVHSATFIGALTGDVLAADASIIMDSGANRGASSIRLGLLQAVDDGTTLLDMTVQATAWFKGDINSDNGSPCLSNAGTPSAATFLGTSTKAKYA